MLKNYISPLPLFDSIDHINDRKNFPYLTAEYNIKDIRISIEFLKSYKGSVGTFNSYRREIERLLHWTALVLSKSIKDLKRHDLEAFIEFCQKPPKDWIGKTKPPRF